MTAEAEAAAEAAYIDAARNDAAFRRQRTITLNALAFHVWCLTKEEQDALTVEMLRERKNLLHGYYTDAEIQSVIDAERGRVFQPAEEGVAGSPLLQRIT